MELSGGSSRWFPCRGFGQCRNEYERDCKRWSRQSRSGIVHLWKWNAAQRNGIFWGKWRLYCSGLRTSGWNGSSGKWSGSRRQQRTGWNRQQFSEIWNGRSKRRKNSLHADKTADRRRSFKLYCKSKEYKRCRWSGGTGKGLYHSGDRHVLWRRFRNGRISKRKLGTGGNTSGGLPGTGRSRGCRWQSVWFRCCLFKWQRRQQRFQLLCKHRKRCSKIYLHLYRKGNFFLCKDIQ